MAVAVSPLLGAKGPFEVPDLFLAQSLPQLAGEGRALLQAGCWKEAAVIPLRRLGGVSRTWLPWRGGLKQLQPVEEALWVWKVQHQQLVWEWPLGDLS